MSASIRAARASTSVLLVGVDRDVGRELVRPQVLADDRRQVLQEDLLGGRERHDRGHVRRGQGRLEDPDDVERHAPDLERVADAHAELAGEVGAEDGNEGFGVFGGERPTLGVVEVERPVTLIGAGQDSDDHVGNARPAGRRGIEEGADARNGRGHPVDRGDVVDQGDRHRAVSGQPTGLVGDDDLARVVVAAHGDDRADLVGHRAEHDEGPDADRDAGDGQGGSKPPSGEVA